MRPAFALLLLLSFLSLAAYGELVTKTTAHYGIDIQDEDAEVTWLLNYSTSVQNVKLTLTFVLPANATLISISDLHGPVLDYELTRKPDGDEVLLTTKNDGRGGPLSLTILYWVTDIAPERYGQLRISQPLCFAITDEASAEVTLPADSVLIASTPSAPSRRTAWASVSPTTRTSRRATSRSTSALPPIGKPRLNSLLT